MNESVDSRSFVLTVEYLIDPQTWQDHLNPFSAAPKMCTVLEKDRQRLLLTVIQIALAVFIEKNKIFLYVSRKRYSMRK